MSNGASHPRRSGRTAATSRTSAGRWATDGAWARSPDAAVRYLAARTQRGRRGETGLAPTSLRRRAAALKGFYRFAFGEGLIDVDVATHLDLPRQSRRLPDTLDVGEVERLLEAGVRRAACATGPCSSCSTPPACGSARPSASIARTCRSTARSCGSSARATRSASSRSARSRSTASSPGSTGRGRRSWSAITWRPSAADRCSWAIAARRLARQSAWAAVTGAAKRAGLDRPGQPAHAAALVRDAPARRRRRPAGRPGVARSCEYLHDPAVHASDRGADPGRLSPGPSAGLIAGGTRGMSYADGLLSTRGADRPPREAALVRVRVGREAGGRRPSSSASSCWSSARTSAPDQRTIVGCRRRRPDHRRARRARLAHPALPEPGIRADEPARPAGRRRPQQDLHGQLAREDQRRAAVAVGVRADLRLRRPRHPHRRRDRRRALPDDPQPGRLQEGDARRQARVRARRRGRRIRAEPAAAHRAQPAAAGRRAEPGRRRRRDGVGRHARTPAERRR